MRRLAGAALILLLPARGCDLEPWLQPDDINDKGYHILCLHGGIASLYVGGSVGSRARPIELPVETSIGARLESVLGIRNFYEFLPERQPDGRGTWDGGLVRWRKQTWALFTSSGIRLEPYEAAALLKNYEGVVLLFEGGYWRWPGIRVGYERRVLQGVILRTIALVPALFELRFDGTNDGGGGLSKDLLRGVVEHAEPQLTRSLSEWQAMDIRTSHQTWLKYDWNDNLALLKNLTCELTRMPPGSMDEGLQVLRYKKGQHYDAHRDYWDPRDFPDERRFTYGPNHDWYNRFATLLWFLESSETGGETWFPRAHGGPIPWNEWTACDDRGELLSGRKGSVAILFYSLQSGGEIDEFSWHCGCPVGEGVKWAANSWFWNTGYPEGPARGSRDSRAANVSVTNAALDPVLMSWRDGPSDLTEVPLATLAPGVSATFEAVAGREFSFRIDGEMISNFVVKPSQRRQSVRLQRRKTHDPDTL